MLQPSPQGRIHPEVRVDCVHSGQRIQEVLQSIRDGTAGCIRPWRPCDAPGALTRQEAHFFPAQYRSHHVEMSSKAKSK